MSGGSVPPFDRAADAGRLLAWTVTIYSNFAHRLEQLAAGIRRCRRATAGVKTPAILKFQVTVKAKKSGVQTAL